MAFAPKAFLYNDSNTLLRDQQHAARLFTDDQFRLAPKHKFLFHVSFGINSAALQDINLVQRHRNEINMLVKSCDLPNFAITAETLNQYNRKKVVQTTHKYLPINITFHDDNMGVINQLWQNYYSYYYADPTSAYDPGAYKRNATKSSDYINKTYGFDNGSTLPFFTYISIYQMSRHEYVCYTLTNPLITSWNHNKVDYSAAGVHDNIMQIMYEAVSYSYGTVEAGDPEGFGLEHYDTTPSPLKSNYAEPPNASFANTTTANNSEFANIVTTQINTYQNTQAKQTTGSTANIIQAATSPQTSVSGLQGYSFPSNNTNTSTVAKISKLG